MRDPVGFFLGCAMLLASIALYGAIVAHIGFASPKLPLDGYFFASAIMFGGLMCGFYAIWDGSRSPRLCSISEN